MIGGLIALLVANAAAGLATHALWRHLRTGRGATDAVLFLVLRLVLLSGAVLAAGLSGFLTPWGLGLPSAAALAVLLALGEHRKIALPDFPAGSGPARALAALAALIALRLLLQVWVVSPHVGDALAYHLPKIGEWIRAGAFTREMGLHPHVSFPAGFELLEAWWVVFLHHDALIEMAGVEFVVLGFAATYSLGRSLELPPRWSFFAGMTYALTPGFHLGATSCLNDAPVAAAVVATAALLSGGVGLPLVAMTAGWGVGIKPTYGFTLPGFLLLAWLARSERRPLRPALGIPLLLAGTGIGAFWYVRNLIWYGNPFHPLGSRDIDNPVAVQFGPGLQSFLSNAADLLQARITDHETAYGANVDYISGWGAPAFAGGLLALGLGMAADRRLRGLGLSFLLALASVFVFVQHDPWCLKYVFFFPAVLALALAWLSAKAPPVAWVATVALGVSFVGTCFSFDLPLSGAKALAAQPWRLRSVLPPAGATLPAASIGCYGGYRANSYLLYGPDFSRRVIYLRSATADALLDDLRRGGATGLYAVPSTDAQTRVLDEAVRAKRLRSVGQDFYGVEPGP